MRQQGVYRQQREWPPASKRQSRRCWPCQSAAGHIKGCRLTAAVGWAVVVLEVRCRCIALWQVTAVVDIVLGHGSRFGLRVLQVSGQGLVESDTPTFFTKPPQMPQPLGPLLARLRPRNALCPPPSQGPRMPYSQGVLQALQQAVCKAQCPRPWGHAPEPDCPMPPPLLKKVPVSELPISTNPCPHPGTLPAI
jgi:hypothetical protein